MASSAWSSFELFYWRAWYCKQHSIYYCTVMSVSLR